MDRFERALRANRVEVHEASSDRVSWSALAPDGTETAATTELHDALRASTTFPVLPKPDGGPKRRARFYEDLAAMNGEMHGERVFPQDDSIHYSVDSTRRSGESDRSFTARLASDALHGLDEKPRVQAEILRVAKRHGLRANDGD